MTIFISILSGHAKAFTLKRSQIALIITQKKDCFIGYVLRSNGEWSFAQAKVELYPLIRWKTPDDKIIERFLPKPGWERMPDFNVYKVSCALSKSNTKQCFKYVELHRAAVLTNEVFLKVFNTSQGKLLPWHTDQKVKAALAENTIIIDKI